DGWTGGTAVRPLPRPPHTAPAGAFSVMPGRAGSRSQHRRHAPADLRARSTASPSGPSLLIRQAHRFDRFAGRWGWPGKVACTTWSSIPVRNSANMRLSALSISQGVVTHVLEHEGRCPYPQGYAEGSVYVGQRDRNLRHSATTRAG